MPIPAPETSSERLAAASDANRRGILLHGQGRFDEAVIAFREGIEQQPSLGELHVNLGTTLMTQGRFDEARSAYERVLEIEPSDMRAHLAMYELEQIAGNAAKALAHQDRVLQQQRLFSERAPDERRSMLVLMAPGDWQANVPLDFLVDRRTTSTHKLYLTSSAEPYPGTLPRADLIFNAIAESDENSERLRTARRIIDELALPAINAPEDVLATSRTRIWEALHGLPHVIVPETIRLPAQSLRDAEPALPYPMVIRPVGSHAGHGLERVADRAQLNAYLESTAAADYYVMPFVDFSKEDGFFRKYRIIVVDGVPYAYHLAISPRWMIHYYNAPMTENAWMREEEERFLTRFEEVFGPGLQRALREIARVVNLEYFGIDCSIDRDGNLLLFEADPAMIVHAGDDPALFGYKIPAAQRIFAAFEKLIDRVGSR